MPVLTTTKRAFRAAPGRPDSPRRGIAGLAASIIAALALAAPAAAVKARVAKGEATRVTVAAGETIDDTLVAAGDTVTVDGVITGNLIAAGRRVVITGTVNGDLIAAAQDVSVEGTVGGNVLSFSQRVDLRGPVARSVHAFGALVQLDPAGSVDGDLIAFGADVRSRGVVGRDLLTFAGQTELSGNVGRHLIARTGRLSVLAPARVEGNLTAHVSKEEQVHIDSGATIVGKTETRLPAPADRRSRFARPGFYLWQALRLGAAFVTGLLLFWLFPALFPSRFDTAGSLLRTMGVGFLAAVAMPVAALIAAITLVGLPVALVGLASWLAVVYAATVLVAAFVGQIVLRRPSQRASQFAAALLVGLLIWVVVTNIPFLGVLVRFLAVLVGFGVVVAQVRRHWQRPQPA